MGVAARSTVFAYDKRKLKEAELPKSLLDLADPALEGPLGRLALRRRFPGDRRGAARSSRARRPPPTG